MPPVLTHHHGSGDVGAQSEPVFDGRRLHVLTAQKNDGILGAAHDGELAVPGSHGDVPGVQPAFTVYRLGCQIVSAVVALHNLAAPGVKNARPAGGQFTPLVVQDSDFGCRGSRTDGAGNRMILGAHREHRPALGKAVALEQQYAGGLKE